LPRATFAANQRVIVAPGKQRPHVQPHTRRGARERPAQHDGSVVAIDDDFMDDVDAGGRAKRPARPRLVREFGKRVDAARMIDVRRVMLRAERKAALRRIEPRFNAVDEDDAVRRRMPGVEQQRVIAPRPEPADRAGREAAAAVAFEPLVL
jgi:hypothetical protein